MTKRAVLEKCIWSLLLCTLFITFTGMGSQAAERGVYNLDQLIQMALESSTELKIADQEILAARSDLRQARGGELPQLDIKGVTGPVNDARLVTVAVHGNTGTLVDNDSNSIGIFGRLDFAITQPLYTFGKISNRKDAAALGVEAQKLAREQKRNEVILNVKELYYAYLVASQGKGAASETDEFLNDAARRIKRLVQMKAKNAEPSDLYRVDAFSAEVKAFAAKADAGSRLAYVALKKAIGLPESQDFKIDVSELPKETVNLDLEGEYVQRALAHRPEVAQVKKGVEAKKKLVCAAQADLYPSFFTAVIGSVAGAPDREKFDNSYISDDFNHAYAGIVAGAEWHFDFGIGKGKLDKAMAEYQKMRLNQELAEKNIPLEVMKDYQDAVEAQKSYEAYEQAAISSRRWIVSAFSNFDFGVGTARDIFDAIDRYGKNQGEYLRALYNYHVALARLHYAIGQRTDMP